MIQNDLPRVPFEQTSCVIYGKTIEIIDEFNIKRIKTKQECRIFKCMMKEADARYIGFELTENQRVLFSEYLPIKFLVNDTKHPNWFIFMANLFDSEVSFNLITEYTKGLGNERISVKEIERIVLDFSSSIVWRKKSRIASVT